MSELLSIAFLKRSVLFRLFFLVGGVFLVVSSHAQITLTFDGLKRSKLSFFALNIEGLEQSSHSDTLIWEIPSEHVDSVALFAFRQNLVNLPQIQDAVFERRPKNGKQHIHWTIREAHTIAPLFSFGGVEGNTNFLIGLNDQHLFGKGHELIAYYQAIQGEHNFLFAYKNPSLRNSRFGVSSEIRRYAAEEPIFFESGQATYQYINESLGFGVSYRLQPRQSLDIGATFFREDFNLLSEPTEILEAPLAFRTNKLLLKAGHHLDRRNFINERLVGSDSRSVIQMVVNSADPAFVIGWYEFRHFGLLGKRGNWGTRIRFGLASNRDSPFAPFALDSQLNIRGSGNRIDRGSAQAVMNLEYRHLVWKSKKEFLALQSVAFSDLGSWRAPGGRLAELTDGSTLRHFVGGGIRLISARAKNAVLRIDYGIDTRDVNQKGLVVGFGQYF